MTRTSFSECECSIARTLDVIGDQWSILIVRDAFLGIDTFTGFLNKLGISRNILTARLENMVSNGILKKTPANSRRARYVLTPRGKELLPTLIAILQWGDRWVVGDDGQPVRVLDRENLAPIQKIGLISRSGKYLELDDVVFKKGPGSEHQNNA